MWGPGVARVAADLALRGRTDLVDVADLGPRPVRRSRAAAASRPTRSRCRSRSTRRTWPTPPTSASRPADRDAATPPRRWSSKPVRRASRSVPSTAAGSRRSGSRPGADRPRRRRPDLVGQLPDGAVRRPDPARPVRVPRSRLRAAAEHGAARDPRRRVRPAVGRRLGRHDLGAAGAAVAVRRDGDPAVRPRPGSPAGGAGARGRRADARLDGLAPVVPPPHRRARGRWSSGSSPGRCTSATRRGSRRAA